MQLTGNSTVWRNSPIIQKQGHSAALNLSLTSQKRRVVRRDRSGAVGVKAALGPGVALAVSQQVIAYGVLVGAEGAYTRGQLAEGAPGRPEVSTMIFGGAGSVLAAVLLSVGFDFLEPIGVVTGIGTAGFVLVNSVMRTLNTVDDGSTWPGPKAWPGFMTLTSFLVASAFFQTFFAFD